MCYSVLLSVTENKADKVKEAIKLHKAGGDCRVDNSLWIHKLKPFPFHLLFLPIVKKGKKKNRLKLFFHTESQFLP